MDESLALLARGDRQRPLLLPDDPHIREQLGEVAAYWHRVAKPMAQAGMRAGQADGYLATLQELTARADKLVFMIEQDNARKTSALGMTQIGLAAVAVLGTVAMIYLLYLWIIAPVMRLREGLQRMAAHEFGTRLPVLDPGEFGALATGFNRMADELQNLYATLEQRVADKTAQLARQNQEISALYEVAAFLTRPSEIDAMCEGFLQQVVQRFGADGASIRTLDPRNTSMTLVSSVGLSRELTEAEHCMRVNDCHCGEVTQRSDAIVIHLVGQKSSGPEINCRRDGFESVAVFRIVAGDAVLGSFSLHFREHRVLSPGERQLLDSLGQLLGVALENRRLAAKERELAVVQERGLVAQGLHDSLAQGLNFLNLQLQLLENAHRRDDRLEVEEILPLLRTGVDESYQDVRELLNNFRTKLEPGSLRGAIEETIARFRRQTGCETALEMNIEEGSPLAPDQQLQTLFILQEALSNIRKHAMARHVHVRVDNARDFTISVRDDGQGYDPDEVERRGDAHVGMSIMRERAARMNALIRLKSAPGQGASVSLVLPASERLAA
jgi:two-component system nitrate/nitrite sensor histidine kinase NarX